MRSSYPVLSNGIWKERKISKSRLIFIFNWILIKRHKKTLYNSDKNILEILLSCKRWDRPRSYSHFLSLFYTWLVKNNLEILSLHRKTINLGHYSQRARWLFSFCPIMVGSWRTPSSLILQSDILHHCLSEGNKIEVLETKKAF